MQFLRMFNDQSRIQNLEKSRLGIRCALDTYPPDFFENPNTQILPIREVLELPYPNDTRQPKITRV